MLKTFQYHLFFLQLKIIFFPPIYPFQYKAFGYNFRLTLKDIFVTHTAHLEGYKNIFCDSYGTFGRGKILFYSKTAQNDL